MPRRTLALVAALAVAGLVAGASPAGALTRTFTLTMTGAEEAPNPGDPDGSGLARISVDTRTDRICYVLTASNIAPTFGAHIHIGNRGQAGPIVVHLVPPTNGRSAGCLTDADADAIVANPAAYYVNIHNQPFPGGALRAQLA